MTEELSSKKIAFEKEKDIKICSPKSGKSMGNYRVDFLIEGKIIVEIKAVDLIPKNFIDQIYSYLKNSKYKLGYFVNFRSSPFYIKRVIYTNDKKPFLKMVS